MRVRHVTWSPLVTETCCSHLAAEPTGPVVARLVRDCWIYRTPYHCPECGLSFAETHAQTTPRSNLRGITVIALDLPPENSSGDADR